MRNELHYFFAPRSIAVIGASSQVDSPGYVIFKNLLDNRRAGVLKARVYGVNIKGGVSLGEKLYRSVTEIPDEIDHAVIAIPAKFIPDVLDECGRKNVKVVTIISGGFSEIGNVELENNVREIGKKYGLRIIGPNGLGVYDPYTGVDTLFIPKSKDVDGKEMINLARPPRGFVAFLTQSGALGGALLDYLCGENLGISKFVSWGNKIDVDEIDMLEYLKDDPNTRVVAIYVEALKERAREFVRIGREFTLIKPIVILKGGITEAGARATQTHTASLAGDYAIYIGAFKHMGAVIVESVMELMDASKALALQPPARGRNIGIISNGGGPGIITADLLEKRGLRVPPLSDDTLRELKQAVNEGIIPTIATFANPIDISGTATDEAYVRAAELVLNDKNIDLVIILALHHPPTLTSKLPDKLISVVKDSKKPVLVMDIGLGELSEYVRRRFEASNIPAYALPIRIVNGACALVNYGEYLARRGALDEYIEKWSPPRISG
ncbi:MAG: CoA-binding protein [Candidatus Korarchaeota archaeon]|nr:acetate--CoA ligase family protein [Thermoproteota archaeon]